MGKTKTERIVRLDFNTVTRKIIEIYEISPDGLRVRTTDGWQPADRPDTICMRPYRNQDMNNVRLSAAIASEKEILADKKNRDKGQYLLAKKYPIKEWMRG